VGWVIWIEDESRLTVKTSTGFVDLPMVASLANVPLLGVGTSADATNPLSMRGPNMLLTNVPVGSGGSGDIRIKLNK
jgi:hypothetical protein